MNCTLYDKGHMVAHVCVCNCADCGGTWSVEIYEPGYCGANFSNAADAIRWAITTYKKWSESYQP